VIEQRGGTEFETVIVREGKAEIIVPKPDYYRVSPNEYVPSKAPVFYNPLMKENRDMTVAVASVMRRETGSRLVFGDSMAGVGIRSIRILVEADWSEAYVNDNSQKAFSIIVKNLKLNGLKKRAYPSKSDANVFQATHSSTGVRFDMLDIDPFGTPIRFLDTGVKAVRHGGILSVTATDTANLFGVQKRAARMLYSVNVFKTGFMRELGVRVLLKAVAEAAARNERGVEPVASITSRHYVKVFIRVLRGRKHAFKTVSQLKFLKVRRIGVFYAPMGVVNLGEACGDDSCLLLGPIYTGETYSREWLEKILSQESGETLIEKNIYKKIGNLLRDDQKTVGSFDLTGLASVLKTSPPSKNTVIEKLQEKGFSACRSGLDNNCIRTDAGFEDLTNIVKSL
jgi:tRNA (guanine26-N2/guanine27-N2)-dimethyltransferase